jgi:hypothetical protein
MGRPSQAQKSRIDTTLPFVSVAACVLLLPAWTSGGTNALPPDYEPAAIETMKPGLAMVAESTRGMHVISCQSAGGAPGFEVGCGALGKGIHFWNLANAVRT